MRIPLIFALFVFIPVPAFAHIGHLGEVAGHGHWVALGAGLTAIALAALLAKKKLNAEQEETAEEAEEAEEQIDVEPAGA